MLIQKTCKEFLNLLASREPSPGGGSAAALTGALSAALTSMVCNFTIDKKGYEKAQEQTKTILKEIQFLQKKLQTLVDLDAQVFNELMQSYKLPKQTREEQLLRNQTIQKSSKKATLVPMQIAKLAQKIQQNALIMLNIGNQLLASDAILSGILALAAIESAYYNVLININTISDLTWKEQHLKQIRQILHNSRQLDKTIHSQAENIFNV